MWLVQRSDNGYRSPWASGRDAKRYISSLGRMVAVGSRTYQVRLPSGEQVTATLVRQ